MADRSAQLPDGWICTSLSNVADVVMGQSPDSLYVNEEQIGIPFLQGNAEFTSKYPVAIHWVTQPRKRSQKNDILISVRAPVGEINIADNDYCIGRGLAAIRFRNNIDDSIGWYLIAHHKGQLQQLAQGSTFTAVSSADISQLELIIPTDKIEQRKIAEILGTVDAAIEQTEALICKQERVKQGLMADLLTRGVDENGEVRATAEERPELYKESELGSIPKEWSCGRVGAFCDVHNHLRRPISAIERENMKGEYPYYGPTGVLDYINEFRVEGEYVLIGEDGDHFLKFNIWSMTQWVTGKYNVNNHAHILKGKNGCSTEWLHRFFSHRDITLSLTRQGAGRYKLNKAALLDLNLLVPSSNEQQAISKVISTMESAIDNSHEHLKKLSRLKQGLMQDLLSGTVRVDRLRMSYERGF